MRRRILFPNWRQVWASLFSQQSAIAGRSPAVIAEPNHGISDEPKQQSRQWIWWVVVLFALYPLSIGPMTGFYAGTVDPWPRMAYEAFMRRSFGCASGSLDWNGRLRRTSNCGGGFAGRAGLRAKLPGAAKMSAHFLNFASRERT
jgi:hypothetical protein